NNSIPDNIKTLNQIVTACRLCPRACLVDRTAGQLGACGSAATAKISSATPHFGEESVLVSTGGSGTIFFTGCNLRCVFCQNADISQSDTGLERSPEQLANLAIKLQNLGCENINFVTPTHVAHAVAETIFLARQKGLTVPTVYNCGGYESVEILMLLDGLIDIYMPDFKYADADAGKNYSGVNDYPRAATAALKEMFRQTGPLQSSPSNTAKRGTVTRNTTTHSIATRGVLVRHLVLPNNLAHSQKVIEIVAQTAPGATINIMDQYRPAYHSRNYPELMDTPAAKTIHALRQHALDLGLKTA
ncbi:MAG: radical SAM protein, partial [Sedimentisphaerales bacterium]|nr:radical SAM protein [Sedimentisphaerales bacterium]